MTLVRARQVRNGQPIGGHRVVEPQEPKGIAGKIIRAIDQADAQNRGCGGCKAIRRKARKILTALSRR